MRTLSQAAQCAKAIRTELKQKYPGVTFRVRSENYSMGDSVNVDWTDGPTHDNVESLLSKYQYGHFNGMEDIYENTNRRDDLAQTKYLFCNRDASPERKQAAVDWLNTHTDVRCNIGAHGEILGDYSQDWREWPSAIVHRMLSGHYKRTTPHMDFSEWRAA